MGAEIGEGVGELDIGEEPEEGLVDLPDQLEGQKIFENFQASVATRRLTHTPQGWGFPHIAEEWSQ
jgi:hypothetical protein